LVNPLISNSFCSQTVRKTTKTAEFNYWYDLRKYSFSIAKSSSVDSFKRNLDKFWYSQDVYYNLELEIEIS